MNNVFERLSARLNNNEIFDHLNAKLDNMPAAKQAMDSLYEESVAAMDASHAARVAEMENRHAARVAAMCARHAAAEAAMDAKHAAAKAEARQASPGLKRAGNSAPRRNMEELHRLQAEQNRLFNEQVIHQQILFHHH